MRARFRVQTAFRKPQPLHRPPSNQVLPHDLFDVAYLHKPVPDRLRIDDDHRPVLALVQSSGLVRADLMLQTHMLDLVLERPFKLLCPAG
jgi:hypothetical protein